MNGWQDTVSPPPPPEQKPVERQEYEPLKNEQDMEARAKLLIASAEAQSARDDYLVEKQKGSKADLSILDKLLERKNKLLTEVAVMQYEMEGGKVEILDRQGEPFDFMKKINDVEDVMENNQSLTEQEIAALRARGAALEQAILDKIQAMNTQMLKDEIAIATEGMKNPRDTKEDRIRYAKLFNMLKKVLEER
jgi:hypothetical protein